MDTVNERGTWISTIAFKDQDAAAVTPTSAKYRIDDIGSGIAVRENTVIPSLAASIEITWTESDTVILDTTQLYETRKLTVWYEWATGQNSEQAYLLVKNLGGITATSPA
jgi:hypothetical protein